MLVLSRKVCERIRIGESIILTVVKIQGGNVRLGIEAPAEVHIARDELLPKESGASGNLGST
jgi:carbon storage regulator